MITEIEREVRVTPEEFYAYMVEQMRAQIESIRGQSFEADQVKAGYTHKTRATDPKTKKTETTRFTIREMKAPEKMKVTYTNVHRKTAVVYEFKPSPKGCLLKYKQQTIYTDPKDESHGNRGFFGAAAARRDLTGSIIDAEKDCRKKLREKSKEAKK